MSRSRSRPEFFVDRSLGRHRVADLLREAGWRVHKHVEVFRERDESVSDLEWLELCGRKELVVLTKDRRLRYRPREIAAIRRYRVKAFVLTSGNLTAVEQAQRLLDHAEPIETACSASGPFVYAVRADRIVRVFPA